MAEICRPIVCHDASPSRRLRGSRPISADLGQSRLISANLGPQVIPKMALGNASQCGSMEEVLEQADYVTLHVPRLPSTKNLIGAAQLAAMKKGSYLINAARGEVVVVDDLAEALRSGHLAGAAADVFPSEPKKNGEELFESPLCGLPNVILTPHIGGSTEEAQAAIGVEVPERTLPHPHGPRTPLSPHGTRTHSPLGCERDDQVHQHGRHVRRSQLPAGRHHASRRHAPADQLPPQCARRADEGQHGALAGGLPKQKAFLASSPPQRV